MLIIKNYPDCIHKTTLANMQNLVLKSCATVNNNILLLISFIVAYYMANAPSFSVVQKCNYNNIIPAATVFVFLYSPIWCLSEKRLKNGLEDGVNL